MAKHSLSRMVWTYPKISAQQLLPARMVTAAVWLYGYVRGVGCHERRGRNKAEGALRPNKLGVGRAGLAVMFEMLANWV
jgi:hypothetical protein